MIGQKLGPYQIRKLLASSNSADVYLAWDEVSQRQVALKLFQAPASQGAWPRSPKQLPQLQHDSLVQLLEQGTAPDGRPYVALEYVEGTSLAAFRRQHNGVVAGQQAAKIATSVANTLSFMHQSGRPHLSLRPDAILLQQPDQLPKVSYASSDALWGADAPSQRLISNAEYLAPEQFFERPVGAPADIYTLGLILYEMLAGRLPYSAVSVADLARQKQEAQPALAAAQHDVDPQLAKIVDRSLQPDPSQRYDSMQAMALELESVSTGSQVVPVPVVAKRKSRSLLPLALLVLLAATLLMMWFANSRANEATGEATRISDRNELTPVPTEKEDGETDPQTPEGTSTSAKPGAEGDAEDEEGASKTGTPAVTPDAARTALPVATKDIKRAILLASLCSAPSVYNRNDSILFTWMYDGILEAGEYLEVRISPSGGLASQGSVPQPAAGANWEQVVPIETFATANEHYTWKVVHMAEDKFTIISESAEGCFSLREAGSGGSLAPATPVPPG